MISQKSAYEAVHLADEARSAMRALQHCVNGPSFDGPDTVIVIGLNTRVALPRASLAPLLRERLRVLCEDAARLGVTLDARVQAHEIEPNLGCEGYTVHSWTGHMLGSFATVEDALKAYPHAEVKR